MKNQSTCYVFVPGLSEKYRSGGLMVIRDVASLLKKYAGMEVKYVATQEQHAEALTPQQAFKEVSSSHTLYPSPLFLVTWGPLVEKHIKMIRAAVPDARILYYAQSFGWNIKVPRDVEIICVSRFVMAQWALAAPENLCFYVPPPLHDCFKMSGAARDIDVFVHTRKQNHYCLEKLLPALHKENLRIEVVEKWITQQEYAHLLNRSKIFLYVTELHKAGWRRRLPGEGFGLPALEALACGGQVASNLLGGVTDFLTPGENCVKIVGDIQADVANIRDAVKNFHTDEKSQEQSIKQYKEESISQKWSTIIKNYD